MASQRTTINKQFQAAAMRDSMQMEARCEQLRAALNAILHITDGSQPKDLPGAMMVAQSALSADDQAVRRRLQIADAFIVLENVGGYMRAESMTADQQAGADAAVALGWLLWDSCGDGAYYMKDFAARQAKLARKHL